MQANALIGCSGPKMQPDVFSGENAGAWPQEELRMLYNHKLAFANSAREGGRHYATGCRHFHLRTTCWILDPMIDPIIDVMIDIEPNAQTVLQDRHHALNLGKTPGPLEEPYCQSVQGWLQSITTCNSAIHRAVPLPNARNKAGAVRAMHALGTRVQNGDLSTVPYATNDSVHCRTLRDMVVA